MHQYLIDHPHNEASALTACHCASLLAGRGWDTAFWIVSDEKKAHKAVALLGRRATHLDAETDWQVVQLKGKRSKGSDSGTTDDGEAMARAGSWVYLLGSHFGSKDGPLDPDRHWIARFDEALVRDKGDKLKVKMDIARRPFLLHRIINDLLTDRGVPLIPRHDRERKDYLRATNAMARDDDAHWRDLVGPGDRPINFEGACFTPHGRLLLGLRYPVTREGHPIIVEIDGIDRMFHKEKKHGRPEATRLWVLRNVGSVERPAGVRELDARGRTIHVITGDLDSDPDESRVLADHPEGFDADNEHHTFDLPTDDATHVQTTRVRSFGQEANVEGIALEHGRDEVWYAHDDERIRLQVAPMDQPAKAARSRRRGGARKK